MKYLDIAMLDLKKASLQYSIWLHLGLLEVKQRYRRSVLGPWWISISMLIFIVAMGKIFSQLLNQSLADYIPFFTTGFLLWSFISSSINESTDLFRSNSGYIKQIQLPYSLYVLKFLSRNLIILAHNLIVYCLVMWFFKINPGWNILWVVPGLLLLTINLYWMCLLVALISTRYRDITQIISSCIQILFFITPITWMPKLLGQDSLIVKFNPFVYFIELIRQPLLGINPAVHVWLINVSIALIGILFSLNLFGRVRSRISFWVD